MILAQISWQGIIEISIAVVAVIISGVGTAQAYKKALSEKMDLKADKDYVNREIHQVNERITEVTSYQNKTIQRIEVTMDEMAKDIKEILKRFKDV
jgi:hypothetical protein